MGCVASGFGADQIIRRVTALPFLLPLFFSVLKSFTSGSGLGRTNERRTAPTALVWWPVGPAPAAVNSGPTGRSVAAKVGVTCDGDAAALSLRRHHRHGPDHSMPMNAVVSCAGGDRVDVASDSRWSRTLADNGTTDGIGTNRPRSEAGGCITRRSKKRGKRHSLQKE